MRTYSAIDIARRFLELADSEKLSAGMTNMKVQKLVFFTQLLALRSFNVPAHFEPSLAWDFGPVALDLYERIRPIVHDRTDKSISLADPEVAKAFSDAIAVDDTDVCAIIRAVWDKFKNWTAYQLSELTHRSGSPWVETYRNARYAEIPHALIIEKGFGNV